ncbi:MAG: hypothetical protein IPP91_12605 [Betaproteobacteria bacterium]|nr:hypothetical protein [Betaproteobacteria bacterium]
MNMTKRIGRRFYSGVARSWMAAFALSSLTIANAFDLATHAAMTSEAAAASQITRDPNASTILKRLGIVDLPFSSGQLDRSLGKNYVYQGSVPSPAAGIAIEARVMGRIRDSRTGLQVADDFSASGWFMRGAIREDDNTLETPDGDDPGGVFDRVFGHFFDPVLNRGLTVPLLGTQPRAVEWALSDAARVQPVIGSGRANQFKIADAREAMWRALTLKTGSWTDAVVPSGWDTLPATKEAIRKAYWATTFRALGDVVHLLQDMAQPQHTRNDAHSGRLCAPGVGCYGGHASFFENYLAARTISEPTFSLEEGLGGVVLSSLQVNISSPQLAYANYPPPRFTNYADYFSKGTNAEGQGLANYSNRGFYSFGTNVNSAAAAQYPDPSPTGSGLGFRTVTSGLTDRLGKAVTGSVTFRTGAVQDKVINATAIDVKLATTGMFDQFLIERNAGPSQYTLNYVNYNEHADLLVPRAVGYSAGLVDYFFRGQMYVAPPVEGVYAVIDHGSAASNCENTCGFAKVNLKVANATPPIFPPAPQGPVEPVAQTLGAGMLVAVAKFRRNTCYTTNLSGEYDSATGETVVQYYNRCVASQPEEIVVSESQNVLNLPACDRTVLGDCPGKAVAKAFNFPTPIPINAASIALQVVFRGSLGSEADAVVVETVDVSEPTYFTYMNATDYIKIEMGLYTRSHVIGDPSLLSKVEQAMPGCIVNGQLKDTCLQPFPISFPLRWGNPGTTVVNALLDLAQPGTFSRFAMLLDPHQYAAIDQSGTPCEPKLPVNVLWRLTQERLINIPGQNAQEFLVTDSLSVRGVKSDGMVVCHNQGDGLSQSLPTPVLSTMPALVGNNANPVPIQQFAVGP